MNKEECFRSLTELFKNTDFNTVAPDIALPGCEGMTLFDEPVFGIAAADDPLFSQYKDPDVIGGPYMTPREWLADARSVLSFFLPFSEEVRRSNRSDPAETSGGWLHARFEGQKFLNAYAGGIRNWFEEQGISVCVPANDGRFSLQQTDLDPEDPEGIHFASAWSERHAAFAAGLGTFSLSRGLITKKGIAGRFGSLILSIPLEPDPRPYQTIDEYCIHCGACIARCPVNAISLEHGKNQRLCYDWVENFSKQRYAPRYGCGKCQVGVPCEALNPKKDPGI